MTPALFVQILVNVLGVLLIVGIAWFHWGPRESVRAMVRGEHQEAAITVKGGYSPDIIVLDAGRPARLRFTRQETSSCSERVVFDGLDISRPLPAGEEVLIELPGLEPGEYPFACQMGMLRGKIVVNARS